MSLPVEFKDRVESKRRKELRVALTAAQLAKPFVGGGIVEQFVKALKDLDSNQPDQRRRVELANANGSVTVQDPLKSDSLAQPPFAIEVASDATPLLKKVATRAAENIVPALAPPGSERDALPLVVETDQTTATNTVTIATAGAGKPFDNRPSYFDLCFIMKCFPEEVAT